MKSIIIFALILIAAQCVDYSTLWDRWHGIPTAWTSSNTSTTYGLSGWKRNGIDGQHYSGNFNNYGKIYTPYLYWKTINPNTIIMCSPKYYLSSESLCRINPYFWESGMSEYCVPNYYNFPGKTNVCNLSGALAQTHGCCYTNGYEQTPAFTKNINSVDPYPTPIW